MPTLAVFTHACALPAIQHAAMHQLLHHLQRKLLSGIRVFNVV
jgi:hypothetical protein